MIFVIQEETFEEMLNRQKAELNALMEAHRKQQLEYMGKYKRKKYEEDRWIFCLSFVTEFHRKQNEGKM